MKRDKAFRFLGILLSVTLFLVVLFIGDKAVVRFRNSLALDRAKNRLEKIWHGPVDPADIPAEIAEYETPEFRSLVSARRAKNAQIKGLRKIRDELVSESTDKNGFQARQFKVYSEENELVYELTYRQDGAGRRVVDQKPIDSDVGVVFMGCSHVYGEGLPSENTIPQILADTGIRANVYNMGIRGGSAGVLLRKFDTSPEFFNIEKKKVVLVFGFQPDQLERESCSWSCYLQNTWHITQPRYVEIDNKLSYAGTHEEFYNAPTLKSVLGHFESVKSGILLPSAQDDEEAYRRHFKMVDELRRRLSEHYEVIDSYHLFMRDVDRDLFKKMVPFVPPKTKAVFVPYDIVFKKNKLAPVDLVIKGDGHPSEPANYIAAKALIIELRKDHPELFKGALH